MSENFEGRSIAGYALSQLVGEGGTAVVYRAEHPTHGTVAFKLLRPKLRQEKTAVARFTREAEFGKRVVHPNVIRTIEIGIADGLHYLVMEWASGELLEKFAKRKAPLPPSEVAHILDQMGAAVKAAHDAGIIHRDLKPDNAMYDPQSGVVKLLDFGIAAATDTRQDERLTRAGYFVGTLMYVAPEALSGELVTPAADQYSLATIAYLLLTGMLPYLAKSPREMFTQLLSQPPVPLNKARANLEFAPAVEATVMRGLARQPSDRYRDVAAFASALRESLLAPATSGEEAADASDGGLLSKVRGLFRR
ncbi:MAG: serine/threonine protein kinase [Gemmatimonadaceae bacterium]|nr:serine/threonine protein kinase [Gemmatimonadaceae bacterium]